MAAISSAENETCMEASVEVSAPRAIQQTDARKLPTHANKKPRSCERGRESFPLKTDYFFVPKPGTETAGLPDEPGEPAGAEVVGAMAAPAGRSLLISFSTSSVMSKPGSA